MLFNCISLIILLPSFAALLGIMLYILEGILNNNDFEEVVVKEVHTLDGNILVVNSGHLSYGVYIYHPNVGRIRVGDRLIIKREKERWNLVD